LKKYGLSASEKIKSRKNFEKIFTGGQTTYSSDNKIRANFRLSTGANSAGVKFAVAVSKKYGNAVWRNRVKRLIREVYRLNKHGLVEKCKINNTFLEIIFSPQTLNQSINKVIGFNDLQPPMMEVISKLKEKI
jgi:ribonuclease P protein component